MKKILLILSTLFVIQTSYSQSDNCSGAPAIANTSNCSSPTGGTSAGATLSFPGCVGNADDDVWYSFVASATSQSIVIVGSSGYDAVLEIFSGSCMGLTSIACVDNTGMGGTENTMVSALTIGATYYFRVFHYYAGSGSSLFTACVTNAPPPPSNDNCTGAIPLSIGATCINTPGNSYGATQSLPGCSGTADDDVWYSFVANNYTTNVTVTPSSNMDAVFEVFSGACGAVTSMTCVDAAFTGGTESSVILGLTPGTTYYVRVYDYYSTGGYPFNICVNNTTVTGQPNDNPCGAIPLPPVTSNCNYMQFSNIGATATPTTLAPAPYSCAGGSPPAIGGYTTNTKDVWFSIVVPPSGNIYITPQPNLGPGFINDGVMALYSGSSCSSLTQIKCADDNPSYPGTANDLLPYIAATGLTPGTTVYLRYWGFATAQGSFGICVQSPTNDNCSSSLYMCNLNGYAASTSAAYTPDRPCNMRGDAEFGAGYTWSVSTTPSSTLAFGMAGPWGVGQPTNPLSPKYDVSIDNNSWIQFTAANTNASFRVDISNCWVGNYPSGGLQMQVFSAGSACCNFMPTSDFKEGSSTFTINANGLTTGNNYYLMVDGYAGDICNYTITALTGVSFPNISASTNSVCPGGSVTLTGPVGASSYTWLPSGSTSSAITVSPGSTITYTLIAGGVCGYKQTMSKQITVNPTPNVLINLGNPVSTCGTQTITLAGSGASTYSWSTGSTSSTINVSPAANTSYTLVGTSAAGCSNATVVTVTVNPIPSVSLTASSNSICSGSSAILSASGASSYTWSTGSNASSISVNPPSATTYTFIGSNSAGCTKTMSVNIGVNSLPTVNSTSASVCSGKTATLVANGATTYTWSNSTIGSSNVITPLGTTNYTVIGTAANGCTNQSVSQVSVVVLPTVTAASSTLCSGSTATINASGANTYTWSNASNGSNILVTPTVNTSYTVIGTASSGCSNTAIAIVTVVTIPKLTSTPSVSPSNCSASNGSITSVVISAPGSPLTYTWTNTFGTNVGNTANLYNQPSGTYNLQVLDNSTGCINNFGPYSIVNPGAPSAPSASASANSLCAGSSINLFSNSSSPGATYSWSGPSGFSSTTQNPVIVVATATMSGVYSVYATASGCSGSAANVTVVVHNNPVPTATSSFTNYCSGNNINLFASSASTYTWSGPNSFSSNNQNPSIAPASTLSSGLYMLSVTDAYGCTGSSTLNLTVNNNPSLISFATSSNVCSGSAISLNASGGNTYVWSGPNGFNSLSQNPIISPSSTLCSGAYSVTTTNTITSCSSSTVVNVLVYDLPIVNASSSSASICTKSSAVLNASGAVSYTWSGPAAYNAVGATQTIPNMSTLNSGNYTVTATDINGCSNFVIIPVYVFPSTTINANAGVGTNTFCSGANINLYGNSSALSYTWSGPGGFASNLQNPTINNANTLSSGVYTLIVTDINACNNSDTVSVNIKNTPALISSNGAQTCAGKNEVLTANFGPGVSVNWYNDLSLSSPLASNTNTYIPSLTTNGTYTFYAQGTLSGCTSSAVVVIANYYNISASILSSTLNGVAPLSVQFTNTSTGINASNNSNWWFGDGNSSNSYNASNVFQLPGTYTVQLVVSNGLCADTADVIINVNPALVFVPEIFTPNGDGHNDFFAVKNIDYFKDNELQIYNRWGNLVYKMSNYNNSWNGNSNVSDKIGGGKLPAGTYFYLLQLNDSKKQVFKGFVQLLY